MLAVVNLKGGAGKTTTAGYAAASLTERGLTVLAVDTDDPPLLSRWHKAVGPQWDCIELSASDLHVRLPGIVGGRWDVVVIDTPPTRHARPIVLSALRAATHVIVPVKPHTADQWLLPEMRQLLDEATELGAEYAHGLLLVDVDARAGSGSYFAHRAMRDGWRVLRAHAPNHELVRQAVGLPIKRASATGYGWAVAELLELED